MISAYSISLCIFVLFLQLHVTASNEQQRGQESTEHTSNQQQQKRLLRNRFDHERNNNQYVEDNNNSNNNINNDNNSSVFLRRQEQAEERELQTATPVIYNLRLQNNRVDLLTLVDGMEINVNFWGDETSMYNIKANFADTKSVYFVLDSNDGAVSYTRRDKRSAFELYAADTSLQVGTHTLSATPYSEKDSDINEGIVGTTIVITFTVVDGPTRYLPKFTGPEVSLPEYPYKIGESQGALLGTDLFSVGGFITTSKSTSETYAMDLSAETLIWRPMATSPISFWTHGAFAIKGDDKFYMCGGYLGPDPGMSISSCHMFDKSTGPMGTWSAIQDIPAIRGGAGMIYIQSLDSLLFSMGAERPDNTAHSTTDKSNTWMLSLSDPDATWIPKATGPYLGNHLTAVTAYDCDGNSHYYFLGGQVLENEQNGNIDKVFEYMPNHDVWEERQSMDEGRGHFSNSAVPYGCGFIIVGGTVDGNPTERTKTNDVSYYDIPTDSWSSLGSWIKFKTPLCATFDDALYCANGYKRTTYKRPLSYPIPYGPKQLLPDDDVVIFDVNFDTGLDDFIFVKNLFRGTTRATYTWTWYTIDAKKVHILMGGVNDDLIRKISSGYVKSFTLDAEARLQVQFDYRVKWEGTFEVNDDLEILCSLDDVLYGRPGMMNDVVNIYYGPRTNGETTGGGFETVSVDLGIQSAGIHNLGIGGFLSQKDEKSEVVRIIVDNIKLIKV